MTVGNGRLVFNRTDVWINKKTDVEGKQKSKNERAEKEVRNLQVEKAGKQI